MKNWKALSAAPAYFAGVEQRKIIIKRNAANEIYMD